MKNIVIDGDNFSDLEGFYTEIDKLLTKDLDWQTGHGMDAFNDLLRGGFGVHEYGEALHIKWIHFAKSRQDLGYRATKNYYRDILKNVTQRTEVLLRKSYKKLKRAKEKQYWI